MFLVCIWANIDVLWYFETFFEFLHNFLSPKRPYEDRSVVRSSKSQNHRKCSKIQVKTDQCISCHYTIVLHVSDTFSDYYRCFYDVLKRFLCFYITFWVQNDITSTKMVRSSKSQNHRKYSKITENRVFWTMCELLAYCEALGMLPWPNYVKIRIVVYF